MHVSRRGRSALALSVTAGVAGLAALTPRVRGQQIPADPIVMQTGDDGNYGSSANQSGFNYGTPWSASTGGTGTEIPSGVAPEAGYAYVDEGYRLRTPATQAGTAAAATSLFSFAGDSLALVSPNPSPYLGVSDDGVGGLNLGASGSYAYLTLKSNAAANTANINRLVLANGGVLFNYANDNQTITGNIYLVPANATIADGTSSGFTTSISGGIVDTHGNNLSGYGGTAYVTENYFTIAANISGGGMLRVENTGGGTYGSVGSVASETLEGVTIINNYIPQVVLLSGNNTFTGGVVLDGTGTAGITGNGPVLAINSPNALGTGTLSILAAFSPNLDAPGVAIDNLTGATEVLTTNNPQVWDGNFSFIGTNSLNMGSGVITMGPDLSSAMQLTVAANVLTLGGSINGGQGLIKAGVGTLVLNGAVLYSGSTNVSAGMLKLGVSNTLAGGVTITAGATLALTAPHSYLSTPSLSIAGTTSAWTGTVDIGPSSLDLPGASIAMVSNQIQQGYAGGTWQGSGGILSSTAAADSTHLTAVGVIVNANSAGLPLYGTGGTISSTFEGGNPGVNDVLVKYTYYGDTNLDGHVDGSDYIALDNGFLLGLTGWSNGDFNYDGVVDGSDYALIDNSFNTQGAKISAEVAAPTVQIAGGGSASAVPEPAGAAMTALAGLTLLRRRRR